MPRKSNYKPDVSEIPNKRVRDLFLRVATESEITTFYDHLAADRNPIALATAYATNIAFFRAMTAIDHYEQSHTAFSEGGE